MASDTTVTIPQALQLAQQAIIASDFQRAEIVLRQILQVEPEHPQALQLFGRLALNARRPDIAMQMLSTSARLQPNDRFIHLDLGNAFLMLGRLEDAAAEFRRCLEIEPNHPGAWSNLAIAMHELARPEQALESFQKALALDPNTADRHNNLGTALTSLGRSHEAASAYRRAIEIDPSHPNAMQNLAHSFKAVGRIDEAIRLCRELLAKKPASPTLHSNLLLYMMYSPMTRAEELFKEHRRWNHLHAAPLQSQVQPHENDLSPDRRLRIGYVSPDMRDHSVAYFFEGLLKSHDPAQVEVFCYADMLRKQDDTSERLKAISHHWTNITGLSDEKVYDLIRGDKIDILVDLAGHTSGTRLLVFARKPAPVQVSYLGYPNTTGLDAIEYYLTDAHLDPPGARDELYSEQLIRLPRTFAVYRPPGDAPDIAPPPARSNRHVTFGSFNTFPKVNDNVIRVWSQILQRVPGSKLLMASRGLGTPAMSDAVGAAFAAHGITADRLEFQGEKPRLEYLATHSRIDILLDPFPVNGHTITCHALWMGVPVISLAGSAHFGRLGASVLTNLGLPELLAQTEEEYVNIAADLAGDLPRLEHLRSTLRERMMRSPLMDTKSLAREIETEYRNVWRKWTGA